MQTNTVTGSIEVSAAREAVLGVLADGTRLPAWAPGFADTVTGDPAAGWQATKDDRAFALRIVIDDPAGTVGYLREIARLGRLVSA